MNKVLLVINAFGALVAIVQLGISIWKVVTGK